MAKKGGGGEADAARADEAARQARIREGTTKIDDIFKRNFTDDYYTGRKTAFSEYATPQLTTQLDDARKQLTFALARSGTLDSSVRAQKEAELQREYDTQARAIADQALSYETDARNKVEDARTNLVATLNATGDAEGAANSAIARSTALSQPNAFSPLTGLFANFTNALGAQAAQERALALSGGTYRPRYNTGLFGSSGNVRYS